MATGDQGLKQHLIDVALRLFAEHGRDGVSLRDIAAEAGVTHGSIRYHFGTKDQLYVDALVRFQSVSDVVPEAEIQESPIPDSPFEAEEYFRALIRRFVAFQARLGANQLAAKGLLQAELMRGDGPDPVFYDRVIKPGHERMKLVVRALRPDIKDDATYEIIAFNVIFQCVMVRIGQPTIKKLLGIKRLGKKEVTRIADLIAEVSLSGIRDLDPS